MMRQSRDDEEVAAHGRGGCGRGCRRSSRQLRRKGFGRLLVDGRAVSFDDLPADVLKGRSSRRRGGRPPARGRRPALAADRLHRDRLPGGRRRRMGDRTAQRRQRPGAARVLRALRVPRLRTSPTRTRSRVSSRSTTRSAPARPATASATSSSSTSTWSCPIRRSRSTRAPSSRGPSRTTGRTWPTLKRVAKARQRAPRRAVVRSHGGGAAARRRGRR